MSPNPAIFTLLLLASLLFLLWSLYRKISLVSLGQPAKPLRSLGDGIREMLIYAFAQKRVVKELFGFNHLLIFWAFIALLLANGEFMASGIVPSLRLSLLPQALYLPIRFLSDIMVALTLVAVAISIVHRTIFPPYPEARTLEAYTILGIVAIHMIAYFGVSGVEIALLREPAASAMPVSAFIARLLGGMGNGELESLFNFFWWLHAIALFIFIAVLIPYTKHLHIITAISNCFLHRLEKPNTQQPEIFGPGRIYGAGQVDRFTWRDLLDTYSCTKCGRCQNSCPAGITGKPLNPRLVIYDIRINLSVNGPLLKQGGRPELPLIGSSGAGSIDPEVIWSCTSCGACMEQCPVFIEHLPKIVQMRRHLVENESKFPDELLNLFENMEQRSNPWGIAPSERAKWCSTLQVKPFVAGETEYLLYVGCSGAFDSRQKQVTVALATILDAAGISWGILGKEEKCCGESLRRLGNEYVFDKMARENVEQFQKMGITKVITQCPHCFTTLKNDYSQYGLNLEVVHHGELIDRLFREKKLQLNHQVKELGKIVFHDSCYLGRHNDVYDPPRSVIAHATGAPPAELERNRENSFCCGGGGGRMWIEEHQGTRINLNRVEEALRHNPDTVCVACPYCMTMIEDGLKDKLAGQTRVKDIAEVVAEGLRPL